MATTHGLSKHPLHKVWTSMLDRCYYKGSVSYGIYGGVGVEVCEEWRLNFKSFYDWATANGWRKGLKVDKDIKGNGRLYSPDTCLIVTAKVNQNNIKSNVKVVWRNKIVNLNLLVEEYGVKYNMVYKRLQRGWGIKDSIFKKPYTRNVQKKQNGKNKDNHTIRNGGNAYCF